MIKFFKKVLETVLAIVGLIIGAVILIYLGIKVQ